jgi:hypothetical protein
MIRPASFRHADRLELAYLRVGRAHTIAWPRLCLAMSAVISWTVIRQHPAPQSADEYRVHRHGGTQPNFGRVTYFIDGSVVARLGRLYIAV